MTRFRSIKRQCTRTCDIEALSCSRTRRAATSGLPTGRCLPSAHAAAAACCLIAFLLRKKEAVISTGRCCQAQERCGASRSHQGRPADALQAGPVARGDDVPDCDATAARIGSRATLDVTRRAAAGENCCRSIQQAAEARPVGRRGTLKCVSMLQGMAALAFRLLTFRRWGDEMPYARRFFVAFGLLILELSIENFFIWCAGTTLLRLCCLARPSCSSAFRL